MRKQIITVFAALALVFGATGVLTCVLSTSGCATKTPQTVAYDTIYSLETGVTAAYDSYLTLIVKQKVSTNQLADISKAFNLFQMAATEATVQVQGNTNAPAPLTLTQQANALTARIAAAK